jgi:N-methylhydantoinase A
MMIATDEVQIGIDIGGTFTDCAVIEADGAVTSAKVLTNRETPAAGFFDALTLAAERLGVGLEELLGRASHIFHGTTVGTNSLIERTGSKTAVLTTRGVGDSLTIMRAFGRVAGLPLEEIIRVSATSRPDPIVPRRLVWEVDERVDSQGAVVVALDESAVKESVLEMVDEGVEAVAICFLWSFLNPAHEARTEAIVRETAPHLYVTRSSELVPKWGEYERLAASAINCYVGPAVERYVGGLSDRLDALGYQGQALFLECRGGVMTPERALKAPLQTIDSGPAGGLVGAAHLAAALERPNVICTDMGGTSFDVGLLVDGQAVTTSTTIVNQYQYFVPRLDIRSIGAGGGSYVRFDPISETMKVGPGSAGGEPGPMCYGRGGQTPTITDADAVLGYINPDYFLAGRIRLDRDRAFDAFEQLGAAAGLDVYAAAAGACAIADHRMADLIRQMSIQQGRDPRDFVVFAYGGAGPVHAAGYAGKLGCREVVIPLGDPSSVWSAFGAAHSNLQHIAELTDMQAAPFEPGRINADLEEVSERAKATLAREGASDEAAISVALSVDMRYRGQLYEVTIAVPDHAFTAASLEALGETFGAQYERLFGDGAGFPEAGIEAVVFRATATAPIVRPDLTRAATLTSELSAEALAPPRVAYWPQIGKLFETRVYWGRQLRAGNEITGPAIIDLPETTVVVGPGQGARVDSLGSIVIAVEGGNVA